MTCKVAFNLVLSYQLRNIVCFKSNFLDSSGLDLAWFLLFDLVNESQEVVLGSRWDANPLKSGDL